VISDAVAPFAMWGAVGVVVLVLAVFLLRKWESGTRARDDLEEVGEAERARTSAERDVLARRVRMRSAALRGWLAGVRGSSRR